MWRLPSGRCFLWSLLRGSCGAWCRRRTNLRWGGWSFHPENLHDKSAVLRDDGESVSLGHRLAPRHSILGRLADAGRPCSVGTVILALIVARFLWRLAHPVAPERLLPPWQRITSAAVHWLLYLLVLLTAFSGWLFASARGWSVSWFSFAPLPMLTPGNRALVKALDGWHQNIMWALLIVVGLHIIGAFVHLFYYRDGVMRRMLPGKPGIATFAAK